MTGSLWNQAKYKKNFIEKPEKTYYSLQQKRKATDIEKEEVEFMTKNAQGDFIRTLREENGWTQEVLAERMGVSKQTVWNWESGKTKKFRRDREEKLAEVFGVTIAEIILGERAPELDNATKKWMNKIVEHIDLVEDRGIFTFELAAKAFAVALIAISFIFYLAGNIYSDYTVILVAFFLIFLCFGITFWFKGEKIARRLAQAQIEREASMCESKNTNDLSKGDEQNA